MAITIEQIHQIANEMLERGENVTQTAIRNRLGGGSFTTIGEALKIWRAEQDRNVELNKIVIPTEIGERAERLTADIWDIAQSLANERLKKDREILDHKEALMNNEMDECQAIIKTLEGEQVELTAQLDSLTAVIDDLHAKLATAEQQIANRDNELALLKNELKTAQSSNMELNNSIKTITAKLDEKTDKVERLTAELATATSEKLALANELTKAQEMHHSETTRLNSTIDELQAKLSKMAIDNATITGRADTLAEQLSKNESTNQAQIAKIEQLTADNAILKAQAKQAQENAKNTSKKKTESDN